MMRLARLPLAAAALVLVVACQGERALTPAVAPPSFTLDDGTRTGGNPDFFFLPPIVPNPSGSANFDAAEFNPELLPVVNVCQLSGNPSLGPVSCGTIVFGPVTAQAAVADQHYQVNWHTDQSNLGAGLNVNAFYRIQVFVSEGGTRLGFADVDPVSSGKELKNLQTGDVFGLVDGRTLPIKFRIEESALCQTGNDTCSSETIVLRDGGSVVLEETGDRVDIPPQNSGRTITVTLQLCDREGGIDVDLRKFGNCLTVTSDPPLGEGFSFDPPASVSMCSVRTDPDVVAELATLSEEQEDLVTMHRQDDGDIFALPHGGLFCDEPIGSGPSNLFRRFARSLGELFAPRPLHAATAVLDVGPSGETDFFSDFQLALSAQLNADNDNESAEPPTDLGTHEPGASVTATVVVTDVLGAAVANVVVRFTHTPPPEATGGGVSGSAPQCTTISGELVCSSGADGTVAVQWTLSSTGGLNQLSAKTIGAGLHTDLDGNGPFDSCVPETEGFDHVHCTGTETVPVDLTEGVVTFTATAGAADLVISRFHIAPTRPTDADLIEFEIDVTNIGSEPVSQNFQVDIRTVLPGNILEGTTLLVINTTDPLDPGEFKTVFARTTRAAATYAPTVIADGTGVITESNEANNSFNAEYVVSETGFLIAFHSERDDGNFEIYRMRPNGMDQVRLTIDAATDFGPDVSFDGSRIAFDRGGEIVVMDADGTNATHLTDNLAHDAGPTWSPDGNRLAFRSDRDGSFEIYSMNTDGSDVTRLTNEPTRDFDIEWSPDGSRIAFTSERTELFQIYLMNPDGSDVVQLTANAFHNTGPTWSPDGSKIAFTSFRDGNSDIYVMNADGTGEVRLTVDPAFDGEPAWCPNGMIVFTSGRDGDFELFAMDPNGVRQWQLTFNGASDRQASCRGPLTVPD